MRCGCTLLVSMLLLVGCGASRRASSTLPTITDEWQRYPARDADALPPDSPPTEVTERALAQLPPTLAEAYRRMHALSYPSFEGAELRQVEVEVHFYAAPSEAMHRWALVVPSTDGGAPWAFVDGTWRPVLALGPMEDLARACEDWSNVRRREDAQRLLRHRLWRGGREGLELAHLRALFLVEEHRRGHAFERCPPMASALPLVHRGRADVVAQITDSAPHRDAALLRLVLAWADSLATRVQTDFHQHRDRSARHHARWMRRIIATAEALGVPLAEMLVTTTAVLLELDRRAGSTPPAQSDSEVETMIRRLEDVAVDQHASTFWADDPAAEEALAGDATVHALVEMGAGARDALVACARSDARLSRSFRFGGYEPTPPQRVVSVSELCRLAHRLGGGAMIDGPEFGSDHAIDASVALEALESDESDLDILADVAAWMLEDPDGPGPQPRNLLRLRGLDDGRVAAVLAGRALSLALASDDRFQEPSFCPLISAALAWSEPSAMWVIDDAFECVEVGCPCDLEVAVALRERRPELVAERADREPWVELLATDADMVE